MTEPTRSRSSRPTQPNAGRGIALVAVAVIIGVLLVWKNPGTGQVTASPDLHSATSTTAGGDDPAKDATTTTAAPTTSVPVAELKVTVANASGVSGAAGDVAEKLKAAGYTSVAALNGDKGQPTKVYFENGFEADAKAVAKAAGLPESTVEARPPEVSIEASGKNAQVIVIRGDGFDPAKPGADGGDAATSTPPGVATTAAG